MSTSTGRIANLSVGKGELLSGVRAQVQSLKEELEELELNYMEIMDEEEGNHIFLKKMRKIVYDAEDVVDTHTTLEANSSANDETEDVCSSLSRVSSKIKDIEERLNENKVMWEKYMREKGVKRRSQKARLPTYSYTHEKDVIGLEKDIEKLVGVLTHEEFKVVSVVGMGGSGKTTLARKLFNHQSVKKHFHCLAWVSVSQQWDAQQIVRNLLKQLSGKTLGADMYDLEGDLHLYLSLSSCLIVFDDVWESEALVHILPALPLHIDKRKIIITTRNKEVVNYPDLLHITYSHEPRPLTDKQSWELFCKNVPLEVNNTMDIAKLEELGKEMLKKCRGLPLAVIALAGILFHKVDLEEWEQVSKAVSSRIREEGKGTLSYGSVNDMLALSYIDLPGELKPCFLYLAQYPEDFQIRVEELIRTWIAEGFIKLREGRKLEEVARGYMFKNYLNMYPLGN